MIENYMTIPVKVEVFHFIRAEAQMDTLIQFIGTGYHPMATSRTRRVGYAVINGKTEIISEGDYVVKYPNRGKSVFSR